MRLHRAEASGVGRHRGSWLNICWRDREASEARNGRQEEHDDKEQPATPRHSRVAIPYAEKFPFRVPGWASASRTLPSRTLPSAPEQRFTRSCRPQHVYHCEVRFIYVFRDLRYDFRHLHRSPTDVYCGGVGFIYIFGESDLPRSFLSYFSAIQDLEICLSSKRAKPFDLVFEAREDRLSLKRAKPFDLRCGQASHRGRSAHCSGQVF